MKTQLHNPLFEILSFARDNGFALGSFNVGNLETLKAVIQAGIAKQAPLIIEASGSEVAHWGIGQLRAVVDAYIVETGLPIILNLDHSHDMESINAAIEMGFDLIHVDASHLPFNDNIALTSEVVAKAHEAGALCEGEMDSIRGTSDDHRDESTNAVDDKSGYTDPQQAADYISKTGIDIFAAFFGNVHGMYAQPPVLDLERLVQISDLTDAFLSLHGGSGIKDEDVQEAIRLGGIVKINVNTELRIAFKESLQHTLKDTNSVKPYEYYAPAMAAVQAVVEHKLDVFGASGKVLLLRENLS